MRVRGSIPPLERRPQGDRFPLSAGSNFLGSHEYAAFFLVDFSTQTRCVTAGSKCRQSSSSEYGTIFIPGLHSRLALEAGIGGVCTGYWSSAFVLPEATSGAFFRPEQGETIPVIRQFEFAGDGRWEYEVDEEAEHPWLRVRHPEYGDDGTELGRSPAEAVAKLLASELKAKYDERGPAR